MAYQAHHLTALVATEPAKAKTMLREALKANPTIGDAAAQLGVSRVTLHRMLRKLKLKSGKPAHRPAQREES